MCQSIKDGGKRCPSQLASSRQAITAITKEFPSIPRSFVDKIFCELVASKTSLSSRIIHASNFEALTGTQFIPEDGVDDYVKHAQNTLHAVAERMDRKMGSVLSEMSAFLGISESNLRDEYNTYLSTNTKGLNYIDSVKVSIENLKKSRLETGGLLVLSSDTKQYSKVGVRCLYHEPSGHLEVHRTFLGLKVRTSSYRNVDTIQWDKITKGEIVGLGGNLYPDEYTADLHSKSYRCPQCGQFVSLNHQCSAGKNALPETVNFTSSVQLSESPEPANNALALAEYQKIRHADNVKTIAEYLEDAGFDPQEAQQIEAEHQENVKIRSQKWQRTVDAIASNRGQQIERLESISSLAFQGFSIAENSVSEEDYSSIAGIREVGNGGRGFGLEIEASIPVDYDYDSDSRIKIQTAIRLELYRRGIAGSMHMILLNQKAGSYKGWNLHEEEPGIIEVVSPVLSDTEDNWQEVQEVCNVLKGYGCTVSSRTGGHVNIDTSSYGKDQAMAFELAQFNTENVSFVNSFAIGRDSGQWRGNKYSGRFNENLRLMEHPIPYGRLAINGKSQSVNLQSMVESRVTPKNGLPSSARAEYRNFNGTLNVDEWKKRVLLSSAITDFVQLKHSADGRSFNEAYEKYVEKNIPEILNKEKIDQKPCTNLKQLRDFISLLPVSATKKQELYFFAKNDMHK